MGRCDDDVFERLIWISRDPNPTKNQDYLKSAEKDIDKLCEGLRKCQIN